MAASDGVELRDRRRTRRRLPSERVFFAERGETKLDLVATT
jgi:hypothetical protein